MMDGALPTSQTPGRPRSDFISSGIRRSVAQCQAVSLFEPSDGANQAWICEEAKAGLSWRVRLKSAFSPFDRQSASGQQISISVFVSRPVLDSRSVRNDVWPLTELRISLKLYQ